MRRVTSRHSWSAGRVATYGGRGNPMVPVRMGCNPLETGLELRANPILELQHEIFLGHQHTLLVWRGAQPLLIELADLGVLCHDAVGEVDGVAHIEVWIRK